MPNRLEIDDELYAVQSFFNSIHDKEFMHILDHLTNQIGHGFDESGCTFSGDLDPGDKTFEGVEFYISPLNMEVVISLPKMYKYLEIVCEGYTKDHPENQAVLKGHLARFQKRIEK